MGDRIVANAKVLGLIGAVLLVSMMVVGFTPMSVEGVSCGSVFRASGDAVVADVDATLANRVPAGLEGRCIDKRSDRKPFVFILAGAAAVVLVAAAVMHDDAQLEEALERGAGARGGTRTPTPGGTGT